MRSSAPETGCLFPPVIVKLDITVKLTFQRLLKNIADRSSPDLKHHKKQTTPISPNRRNLGIQATPALRGPEHYRAFYRARRPQKKTACMDQSWQ